MHYIAVICDSLNVESGVIKWTQLGLL